MKLVTTKQALVECLGIVNKAVSSRSSIQVLSGVLIDAREEGVTLSATDMEISIKAPLLGDVEQAGSLVVPARIATDIARSLPAGRVVIEQRAGETQVEIQAGESLFDLHSLPAADFPQLPVLAGERFTVSRVAFIETVDRVASSASRDETRPVLTGVLVQFTKHAVRMVATDSYRLSVKETPLESSVPGTLQAIAPARTLLELSRIAAALADETIAILPTENQILFEVGGVTLVSRLIDGQFPNYKQLIPETFDYEVAVDHDELLEAIRRVGLLAQKNAPLRLQFADNTLTVSAESQDVGKAHEAMPVQYSGESLAIGFNPEFLEAGVASVKESPVYLRFISPLRPGLVKGAGDDFLYLVMPIRLND
ncbi:MAG: DNA polymerase III subunit beta [Actinobacteria bacterium RBG_16_64_13]|nr:MAG: DNA polymerase III subunit beta [Actinobacteria bacterium RBG_16_64_13]